MQSLTVVEFNETWDCVIYILEWGELKPPDHLFFQDGVESLYMCIFLWSRRMYPLMCDVRWWQEQLNYSAAVTSNIVASYTYVLYLHNTSIQECEINCHLHILWGTVISHILSHNLPGVTVDDGKQVCRSVPSMYAYLISISQTSFLSWRKQWIPQPSSLDCGNCIYNWGGYFPSWYGIPFSCWLYAGSLEVFCDLLVTIADEFIAQQIRNIKQELFICNRDDSWISDPFSDRGGLSPSPDLQGWLRIVMCAP